MIKSNCHTHTVYCDGKNTAREMIEAAIDKGFVSLGFSCHSPMIYENDWAINKDEIKDYLEEIHALKKEYSDRIDILCGVEADKDYSDINFRDFDYAIGSVHQFIKGTAVYEIDLSAERLSEAVDCLFGGDVYRMSECYFNMVADFICQNTFEVVGHFDLITKFNEKSALLDENNPLYQKSALNAVDRILNYNKEILFEVNTGAMFRKGNKKPYPAPFIMEHLHKRSAKITITSDAHCCEALDFAFENAAEYCKSFGFENSYILTGDGIKMIRL